MRAVELRATGKPNVLALSDLPEPVPGVGEVRVRLDYTGINYAEILSRKGLYSWAPERPYVLGMEGAGVIDEVGDGVDPARVGRPVMVGTQYGCYSEKVVVPVERAIPAIESFTMEENAAFPVNYMTAWVALAEMARVAEADKVVVTAAAGGVGTAAVQLAARLGCEVYGLVGSREKLDLVRSLGAREALSYGDADCFERLRALSGGADVVLETVGGRVYRESQSLLNPFGRIVVAGFAGLDLRKWSPLSWWRTWRDLPRAKVGELAEASTGVMATHLGYLLTEPARLQAIFERLRAFVAEAGIKPVVGRVFPFDDVAEAHAFVESRASVGKVLLRHGRGPD
ncbi:MAG: zinc-binding dehydrogenase [Gemmatimonadetes bacterium]|nr:zinc-binding dehydrogenase [Gemmatimonadota bacterium]NIO32940.1 zinc-binding dehydrogenase [Gemmatimonadota bacterium]